MSISFRPVTTPEDIERLAVLAKNVWQEYFTSLLKEGQVEYMVEKFQSVPALTQQIGHDGYRYYFMQCNDKPVGYIGIKEEDGKLFLSKLYLKRSHRGKGIASRAFAFLEGICAAKSLSTIWLTVNRYNENTIAIYKKKGFTVIREQAVDIGGGYVMDDFVMEKVVGR